MIINNTGTFYVEGDYAQGDTILKAGDWELRANGSKNAFAYSPETFVRRNLLNWSEDFSQWGSTNIAINGSLLSRTTTSASAHIEQSRRFQFDENDKTITYFLEASLGTVGTRYAVRLQPQYVRRLDAVIDLSTGTIVQVTQPGGGWTNIVSEIETLDNGHIKFRVTATYTGTENSFSVLTGPAHPTSITAWEGATDTLVNANVYYMQLERAATPSDYQRTTTHVPRPFAIKDELVTGDSATFDNGIGDWVGSGNAVGSVVDGQCVVTFSAQFVPFRLPLVGTVRANTIYELSFDVISSTGMQLFIGQPNRFGTRAVPNTPIVTGKQTVVFSTNHSNSLEIVLESTTSSNSSITFDNVSLKEVQQPLTLGNGNHKDFRYYPKTLSQNETEALTA